MTDNGYDGLLETAPDIAPEAEYSMISCFYLFHLLGYHFPPVFFGHFFYFEFAPFFRCFVCFAATVRHI